MGHYTKHKITIADCNDYERYEQLVDAIADTSCHNYRFIIKQDDGEYYISSENYNFGLGANWDPYDFENCMDLIAQTPEFIGTTIYAYCVYENTNEYDFIFFYSGEE